MHLFEGMSDESLRHWMTPPAEQDDRSEESHAKWLTHPLFGDYGNVLTEAGKRVAADLMARLNRVERAYFAKVAGARFRL
jgi:hypothetical protein